MFANVERLLNGCCLCFHFSLPRSANRPGDGDSAVTSSVKAIRRDISIGTSFRCDRQGTQLKILTFQLILPWPSTAGGLFDFIPSSRFKMVTERPMTNGMLNM